MLKVYIGSLIWVQVSANRNAFEEQSYCSSLFITASQAFDKAYHELLIFKLRLNLNNNLLKSYIIEEQESLCSAGQYFGTSSIFTLYLRFANK